MNVTPVGTCRITTPLRRAAQRGEIGLALNSVYGFVHTSREALQMVRHIKGEYNVPKDLESLVARPNYKPRPDSLVPELLLIEISSLKDVRIDDTSLQLNYMQRDFGDFFLDKERAKQFWRFTGSQDGLIGRRKWLEGIPAFMQLDAKKREKLASITRHMLSKEDIKSDIREIKRVAGKTAIAVVSHVDARKPDNSTIASRSQLIEWLEETCTEEGVMFLNPTLLMNRVGQSIAMERGGQDLTHYTPLFSDKLFLELVEKGILKTDDDATTDELALLIQEAAEHLRQDRVLEAGNLTYSLLQSSPRPEVEELAASLESRIGNHRGSLDRLKRLRKQDYRLSEDARRTMMIGYHALGDFKNALREANGLLAEEIEGETVLRIAALSAEALDRNDEAISLWTILHGQGVEQGVQNLIRLAGYSPTVQALAKKELNGLADKKSSVPADLLWRHFVDVSDFESSRIAARHLRGLSETEARSLLDYAKEHPRHQAELARIFAQSGLITKKDLKVMRDCFLRKLSNAKDSDPVSQLPTASALVLIDKSNASRKLLRDLRTTTRRELANLQKNGEHKTVIDWVKKIMDGSVHIPKAAFFAGRSAAALKDPELTIYWLLHARLDTPSDAQIEFALLRAYDRNNHQENALRIAFELMSNKKIDALDRERISKQLSTMQTRTIRRTRELIEAGQFPEAIEVLDLMEKTNMKSDLVSAERLRLIRAMEAQLLESSLDDTVDVEWLGTSILDIDSNHQRALKSLATFLLRARRYVESRYYWARLAELRDNPKTALAQVGKCERLLAAA